MKSIISQYISLQNKEYNILWLSIMYIVIPVLFTGITYIVFCSRITEVFKNSWSDIITMLSITNGFLLSSISIVIASTNIDKNEAQERRLDFGKISRMREIMMYDILFQILFIIPICLLIIFVKNRGIPTWDPSYFMEFGTVYLLFISISIMAMLAYRFISYQSYIERK